MSKKEHVASFNSYWRNEEIIPEVNPPCNRIRQTGLQPLGANFTKHLAHTGNFPLGQYFIIFFYRRGNCSMIYIR